MMPWRFVIFCKFFYTPAYHRCNTNKKQAMQKHFVDDLEAILLTEIQKNSLRCLSVFLSF